MNHDDDGFYFDRKYIPRPKSVSYYFDRIRINVYFDRNHLLSIPELRYLNKRHVIDVFEAYGKKKERRYNTRIEVTAPTNETLDIIERGICHCYMSVEKFKECENIDPFVAISKVEIARDFIFENKRDASSLADRLMSMTGKKYTASFKIYDAENDPTVKKNPSLKKEIFSTRTGYWGNQKSFEYVVYGRYSKINKQPSAHTEWRIIGAHNIWKRTGIKSIADMKNFDFEKFFEKQDKKFLVYETIDYAAIGRWLEGIDGRRKLTKRQKMSVEISGQHFCSGQRLNVPCKNNCRKDDCQSLGCEIGSAAALKQYLDQNKGKIRNGNNKILSGEKNRFFVKTPITIYSLLK